MCIRDRSATSAGKNGKGVLNGVESLSVNTLFRKQPLARRFALTIRYFFITVLLGLVAGLALGSVAQAAPEDIQRVSREAQELRDQIESLGDELSAIVEEYNYAQFQLAETDQRIVENRSRLQKAESDLAVANSTLEKRIRDIYMESTLDLVDVLLTARSFTDLVNRWDLLTRVGQSDSEVVNQVAAFKQEREAAGEALAEQKRQRESLLVETEGAKSRISDRLAEREELLRDKRQEIAVLEKEERERQERLEREAQEAARKAAEAAAQEAERQAAQSSGTAADGDYNEPVKNVSPSEIGDTVVETAMRYRGVPYVWGGSSPSGFDCSGLVRYSFAQLGVSLPHSSRAQFKYGTAVARDNLLPGDLVFFGSPIHHVGIYVGGGNMINAPYTGTNVRVDDISRRDYVGARRIK